MQPSGHLMQEATDVLRKLVPFLTDSRILSMALDSLMTGEFATCPYRRSDVTNPNFLAARIMSWAFFFSSPVDDEPDYESVENLREWVRKTKFFLDSHNAL